jgi:hypothetical protein
MRIMPAFTATIASSLILPGLPRYLFADFRAQMRATVLLYCTAGIVAYRARFENMRNDNIGT